MEQELWISICELLKDRYPIWKLRVNINQFYLGKSYKDGMQIYYAIDISKWDRCNFNEIKQEDIVLEKLTSEQRVERLKDII